MMELLQWAGARWAAFMWPSMWDATIVAVLALGVLIPCVRGISPALAMTVAAIALLKFYVPPTLLAPIAIVDRAAGWLEPAAVRWFPETWVWPLMAVHLIGVTVALTNLAVRKQSLRHERMAGRPVPEGALREDLGAAAEALRVNHRPTLILSDSIDAPVAIGVRSPAILLPAVCTERLTREQLRLVLAHELAHHKTRDLLGELLLTLTAALWWFHPAVWALVRRVRELREERCDDLVVRAFRDPEAYCRAILAVAESQLPSPAIAVRRHGHPLGRRFDRLLSAREPRRWQRWLAVVGAAAFAVGAIPNTPGRDDRSEDSAQEIAQTVREQVRIKEVRRIQVP